MADTNSIGDLISFIVIGQESIRVEDRKAAAAAFAQKMVDKPLTKPSAKPTDKKPSKAKEAEPKGRQGPGKTDKPLSSQPVEAQDSLDNLVIILEPNAARFELHAVDNRVLAGFLHNKFNVLVFNYLGYDSAQSIQPSLDEIKASFKHLLKQVQLRFRVKRLVIYGKSLGGYFAAEKAASADLLILDRSFFNLSLLPRIRYSATVQTIFDLFIQEKSRFGRLLQVKGNIVIIYDPADEIINLSCSSFLGVVYLLHETLITSPALPVIASPTPVIPAKSTTIPTKSPSPATPPTVTTSLPKPKGWLRRMADISRGSRLAFNSPDRLLSQIDGVISPQKLDDLYHKLSAIFEFVKLVDLDARIDESQTLRRSSSFRMSTRDIGAQVSEFLKKNPISVSCGGFNDKEGLMLKAFTQESNGLSEIIIKFVKFMHRMEVCTLSAFDLFCPKTHDQQMLKVFFWAFWFMHSASHLRDDAIFGESKFNPGAILKGDLTSHRRLRAEHPNVLRETS